MFIVTSSFFKDLFHHRLLFKNIFQREQIWKSTDYKLTLVWLLYKHQLLKAQRDESDHDRRRKKMAWRNQTDKTSFLKTWSLLSPLQRKHVTVNAHFHLTLYFSPEIICLETTQIKPAWQTVAIPFILLFHVMVLRITKNYKEKLKALQSCISLLIYSCGGCEFTQIQSTCNTCLIPGWNTHVKTTTASALMSWNHSNDEVLFREKLSNL